MSVEAGRDRIATKLSMFLSEMEGETLGDLPYEMAVELKRHVQALDEMENALTELIEGEA